MGGNLSLHLARQNSGDTCSKIVIVNIVVDNTPGCQQQPGVSPFRGARERPAVESTDDESGARGDRQDGAGGAQQSTRGRSVRGGRGGFYLYNQQDFPPLPGHREPSSTFESRGLDPGVRGEGHDGGVRLSQGEGLNQERGVWGSLRESA